MTHTILKRPNTSSVNQLPTSPNSHNQHVRRWTQQGALFETPHDQTDSGFSDASDLGGCLCQHAGRSGACSRAGRDVLKHGRCWPASPPGVADLSSAVCSIDCNPGLHMALKGELSGCSDSCTAGGSTPHALAARGPQSACTHPLVQQIITVAFAAAGIRIFLLQRASAACWLPSQLTLFLLLQVSGDAKWATGVVKENVGHVLGNEQMKADVSTCHEADCAWCPASGLQPSHFITLLVSLSTLAPPLSGSLCRMPLACMWPTHACAAVSLVPDSLPW